MPLRCKTRLLDTKLGLKRSACGLQILDGARETSVEAREERAEGFVLSCSEDSTTYGQQSRLSCS